jgi:hypothetical protein
MKKLQIVILLTVCSLFMNAHPSYTGYSGGTGSKGTCSTPCHGSSSGGTITVTGFPVKYTPGTSYPITVKRVGGSLISNFNCSTRKGTTTTVAGTFTVVSNAALYSVSGYESGVRASVNNIDSARFVWVAPAAASGSVTLYLSGLQGSKSGAVTKVTLASAENVTGVVNSGSSPGEYSLEQNYPNPFNPATSIRYSIATGSLVSLNVYDILGHEVATLANGWMVAGMHVAQFDASELPSGTYFYRLRTQQYTATKRLLLIK